MGGFIEEHRLVQTLIFHQGLKIYRIQASEGFFDLREPELYCGIRKEV